MNLKINYKAFNVNGLSIFYLTAYFIINIIKTAASFLKQPLCIYQLYSN